MISQEHRFHGHGALRFVHQNGKIVRGDILALKYTPNSRRKVYRCSVVVSKKISKSAVVRNRIRRRIYEQVRLNSSIIKQPLDLVFLVNSPSLAEIDAQKLAAKVVELLSVAAKPS